MAQYFFFWAIMVLCPFQIRITYPCAYLCDPLLFLIKMMTRFTRIQAEIQGKAHRLPSTLCRIIFCYYRVVFQDPIRIYLLRVFSAAAESSCVWTTSKCSRWDPRRLLFSRELIPRYVWLQYSAILSSLSSSTPLFSINVCPGMGQVDMTSFPQH